MRNDDLPHTSTLIHFVHFVPKISVNGVFLLEKTQCMHTFCSSFLLETLPGTCTSTRGCSTRFVRIGAASIFNWVIKYSQREFSFSISWMNVHMFGCYFAIGIFLTTFSYPSMKYSLFVFSTFSLFAILLVYVFRHSPIEDYATRVWVCILFLLTRTHPYPRPHPQPHPTLKIGRCCLLCGDEGFVGAELFS